MVSFVRSRPNHYDTLGVAPCASDEEISHAFARKMTLFAARPLGATAQVIGAYETLKDAVRRLNYDRSLGLVEEPRTAKPAFSIPRPWQPFTVSVHTELMEPRAPRVARDPSAMLEEPRRAVQNKGSEPLIEQMLAVRNEPSGLVDYPAQWKGPALTLGGLLLGAGLIGAMVGLSVSGDEGAQAEPVPTLVASGLTQHSALAVQKHSGAPARATGSNF
jgi:hypothetical protein